ncbi:hypothetical protein FRACYDRAFT_245059 [Fragilariopsis cylindrus CCMP1102]|uniref:F-box domain-containing protein n=1 Tax=Fragilariopsis cylindrus CCMP1102 TaxID=635003 RepID=A0A1E7F1I9_9STRA|nr:hypothetical protein FRACYDRAFT_245059 [Fragilariopsis cylindrus CCMP1102]|eukprot:OEU11935.1 hypothetical protein FRACYDRAFT_245059 [Fragilariopsis cylindrus CCMP1102]
MYTRQAKRRRLIADENDLFFSSLLPIVNSGYISTKDLGRLAQTNKVMKTAVIDDKAIWVSLYKQMNGVEYGIPKEILDKVGHMWLVIQMQKKTPPARSLAPPTHTENDLVLQENNLPARSLAPPTHTENDLVLIGEMFSITGEDLIPFLNTGGIEFNFDEPIIVADAEMINMCPVLDELYGNDKRREVGPTDIPWRKTIDFQVRLLRLGDMKSCCCCFFDPESNEFMPEEWQYTSLRPLDLSLDPSKWNNSDIDKLDFGRNINEGFGRICSGFFAEKGLPLQDSVQAKEIKARFPHRFCFLANMTFGVSLNKKIIITGCSIYSQKAGEVNGNWSIEFQNEGEEEEGYEEEGKTNNGVTVAHILSELYCPED